MEGNGSGAVANPGYLGSPSWERSVGMSAAKQRYMLFIGPVLTVCLVTVAVISLVPEQGSSYCGPCYKTTTICWSYCGEWYQCVPVPTSALKKLSTPDPSGYNFSAGGNCGACLHIIWPHLPNFKKCGQPMSYVSC